MPKFPVFDRSGEVTVSIKLVERNMIVTADQLTRLHNFHHKLFSNVLRLEKDPMAFDAGNSISSSVIVPLIKGDLNSL